MLQAGQDFQISNQKHTKIENFSILSVQLSYNDQIDDLFKNITIQFQMKVIKSILIKQSHFNDKSSQITEEETYSQLKSKPMKQQALNYIKNLHINRLTIPKEISLQEKLNIYLNEYNHLYEQNKRLNRQFIEAIEKKNELTQNLILKKKLNEAFGGKVKRKRRFASQIRRQFCCPIDDCEKRYGRDGSLTQHVKIKHEEYFNSGEYQTYINGIIKERQALQVEAI